MIANNIRILCKIIMSVNKKAKVFNRRVYMKIFVTYFFSLLTNIKLITYDIF